MAEKVAVGDTVTLTAEVSIVHSDGRVTLWLHGLACRSR